MKISNYLYHSTNIRNLNDIQQYGLLPTFAETLKTAYADCYDFDKTRGLDSEGNELVEIPFDGIIFFSERPKLKYSQPFMSKNFKWDEALLCLIEKNDTIYHKINDYPLFTDCDGNEIYSINYINKDDMPIFIETGDWFSFEEQKPDKILTGKELYNFMQKFFLKEFLQLNKNKTTTKYIQSFENYLQNFGTKDTVDLHTDTSTVTACSVGKYLINKDVKNFNIVETFVKYFHLSKMVIDIWKYAKNNFNLYPDEITLNQILYLKDNYKIIIQIDNGEITNLSKTKIEYIGDKFKPKVISSTEFSFDKFKYLLEN